MTKIAIVDIDGVIANADARFAKAELTKEQWLMERQQGLPYANDPQTEKEATNVYWRTVFTPELVALDTLIEGAEEALEYIMTGYDAHTDLIFFLTSRPLAMAEATIEWLNAHMTFGFEISHLIFKAPAFQYTKTVVWKAGMIQTLAALYGASELVVIDDEQANIDELLKHAPFPGVEMLNCYTSLQEAAEDGD